MRLDHVKAEIAVLLISGIVLSASVYAGFEAGGPAATRASADSSSSTTPEPGTFQMVRLSGSLSPTGAGTSATQITFSGISGNYTAGVTGRSYDISLPGSGWYLVTVRWRGNYSWQLGSASAAPPSLNLTGVSGPERKNFTVSTPDSDIHLTGIATTGGLHTKAGNVTFTLLKGVTGGEKLCCKEFHASMNGSKYSVTLPNIAHYVATFEWAGSYPWQRGYANSTDVEVKQGPGESNMAQNIAAMTPNSVVKLSGVVVLPPGGTPTSITFSADGLEFNSSLSGASYSIQVANLATYSVSVRWSNASGSGTCAPGQNPLIVDAAPGTTAMSNVDFSC